MSLKLSDTRVYEPQIRARLGITTHERVLSPLFPQVTHELEGTTKGTREGTWKYATFENDADTLRTVLPLPVQDSRVLLRNLIL